MDRWMGRWVGGLMGLVGSGWVGELMDEWVGGWVRSVGVWMGLLEMPCSVIKSIYCFCRRPEFCSEQPH